MMTRQRSAKAAKSPVKPAEKPRQSPAEPAEVPWQARRKRHRDGEPSLRRQEQHLALIKSRIEDLDEKIPASKAQFDDYVHSYKFAAFEIRVLKKCRRDAVDKIKELQAQLEEATAELADTDSSMRVARRDYDDTKERADEQRLQYLTMVDDRALYRRMHKQVMNKLDCTPSRTQSLLLEPYIDPVDVEDTDAEIPDNCDDVVGPAPHPEDHYVPSTP